MGASITSTHVLDLEIAIASIGLGSARSRWSRCPSAENEQLIEQAQAEVDRLLDQRLLVPRC